MSNGKAKRIKANGAFCRIIQGAVHQGRVVSGAEQNALFRDSNSRPVDSNADSLYFVHYQRHYVVSGDPGAAART